MIQIGARSQEPEAIRMAGPQVQHSQRPNSAYYTGLNGSGSGGAAGGASSAGGMATSASHTGLHALRQVSNETELIYRGSHSNGTVNELPSTAHHLLTGRLPQQKPQQQQQQHQQQQQQQRQQVSSIAGTGSSATDALINTITSGGEALEGAPVEALHREQALAAPLWASKSPTHSAASKSLWMPVSAAKSWPPPMPAAAPSPWMATMWNRAAADRSPHPRTGSPRGIATDPCTAACSAT